MDQKRYNTQLIALNKQIQKKKVKPIFYKGDQILKYMPRHSFSDFVEEINLTEGQLIQIMPYRLREMNKNFQFTKRTVAIAFWALNIGFATFCHRIHFLKRVLRNEWGMFAFKVSCVGLPIIPYIEVENNAIKQNQVRLFRFIEDDFRSYKNTGDAARLNPEIQLYDLKWKEDCDLL